MGRFPCEVTEQCDEAGFVFLRAFEADQGNLGKHKDTAFSCSHDLQPASLSLALLAAGQVSKCSSHVVSGRGF